MIRHLGVATPLDRRATPAVNAFLEQGGGELFEQDLSREALVQTFNPGGWLRRKSE